jgi:hypothetical protein
MTKPSTIGLLAAAWIFYTTAAAGDAGPLPQAMYVRGGFNGWGTDNALTYKGAGIYEARIVISPGNHSFKLGSGDWGAEWVLNPNTSVTVGVDTDYTVDTHPGPQDYLFVRKTSEYRFTLDMSNTMAPKLRVALVASTPGPTVDPHLGHEAFLALHFKTYDGKTETALFSADDASAPLRSYAQSSTMQLRDPGPQNVTYAESAELPRVRSGNLAFDALFALAGSEMKLDSVAQIRDGNYNGGAPVACNCFETGEKWHYVWTRDLSYAASLGLALLDPERVQNSLEFKLSAFRPGVAKAAQVAGDSDGLQIVQDTGSGGSWPVSTDRVTWAFGAEEVLNTLPPALRPAFAARALKALVNTIENDRLAAFDRASGLYTGEQSFLDWREQSYAGWIVNDLSSMATSKALSTNVGHYKALSLASDLAREQGDATLAKKYAAWAASLKKAINARLWLADAGMYSSLSAGHFDGAPMHKFDWLGQALAVVTGVADEGRAQEILANYPHGPMGAPVIFPQQLDVPIYHNRAIWPFVTAFGLRAAALSGNVSVADAAYETLMRGAALNLSNMENLEWLSAQPLLLDEKHPSLIGPVINSRRQLWSVGAYLGMVIKNVFGISTTSDGILVRPFITSRLRREVFGQSDVIALKSLRLRGHTLNVAITLPKAVAATGYFAVDAIVVNGKRAASTIRWSDLANDSTIEVILGELVEGQQGMRRVRADPFVQGSAVFGPREPVLGSLARDAQGRARLGITGRADDSNTVYNVYRDGRMVASRIQAGTWTDPVVDASACYAVEAQFSDSGNRSHHSAPRCIDDGIDIAVTDPRVASSAPIVEAGARFAAPHVARWGAPSDTFAVRGIRIDRARNYQIALRYHNSANQINLGISGGVKWLTLKDAAGRIVAQGVVQLPHARLDKANTPAVLSTPLAARLKPGVYSLQASDFYNMSYLQSNSTFGAAGGVDGPSNKFDIYGVRIIAAK